MSIGMRADGCSRIGKDDALGSLLRGGSLFAARTSVPLGRS
jgi:hypothetical protein